MTRTAIRNHKQKQGSLLLRNVAFCLLRGIVITLIVVTASQISVAHAASSEPALYFSELLWGGSDRSTSDEWFELGNASSQAVSLDGWLVVNNPNSCAGTVVVSLNGYTIAPSGYLLIAHASQHQQFTAGESALATDPDIVMSSLTLSNTQLGLGLCHGNALVDSANNGGKPFTGSTKPPTSMERIAADMPGSVATSWRSATRVAHIDQGSTTIANPTHAGAPSIATAVLANIPLNVPTAVTISVNDPDGDDDIQSVTLACGSDAYHLTDTGVEADGTAGDRRYTTMVTQTVMSRSCQASVTDRSGLSASKPFTLSAFVSDAPVEISEILPSPSNNSPEFIELSNSGSAEVLLNSWTIDDDPSGGSSPFLLNGVTIPAQGYVVIYATQSKIALNNTGDHAVLKTPLGVVKSDVVYGTAPTGKSWGIVSGNWDWESVPTPGLANLADVLTAQSSESNGMSIVNFAALKTGQAAQVTGTVVALPGMLGSQYFLIDDGTGTAQVYRSTKVFPALSLGDSVTVIGTRSSTAYPRLLLVSDASIMSAAPISITPHDLGKALAAHTAYDMYVTGSGTLTKRNNRSLVVLVNGQSVTIEWPDTLPQAEFSSLLTASDVVQVTGILTNADSSNPTVVLRSNADVTVTSHTTNTTGLIVSAPTDAPSNSLPRTARSTKTIEHKPTINQSAITVLDARIAQLRLRIQAEAIEAGLRAVGRDVQIIQAQRSFLTAIYGTITLLVCVGTLLILGLVPTETAAELRISNVPAP